MKHRVKLLQTFCGYSSFFEFSSKFSNLSDALTFITHIIERRLSSNTDFTSIRTMPTLQQKMLTACLLSPFCVISKHKNKDILLHNKL